MMQQALLVSLFLAAGACFPHLSQTFDHLLTPASATRRSTTILGDLTDTADSALSAAGQSIKEILAGESSGLADSTTYNPPGPKDSSACRADQCCIWSYIVQDMSAAFHDGRNCNSLARQAIRLGFHDAATWNVSLSYGGADGSILLSGELLRSENRGLDAIATQMTTWSNGYKDYGISMADLIQFGALTATVVCPGGPRVRAFVGRPDSNALPPEGLLPSAFSDAQTNIDLFAAKTFSSSDLVALIGAHSVSQQFFVDPSRAGQSQDSTDGVWDTTYYSETAAPTTPPGVFKFPSDVSLANYTETQPTWQSFENSLQVWQTAFAQAYFRMSLLGVENLNSMTECSQVLPLPRNV